MRVVLHRNGVDWQVKYAPWFVSGFKRHGIECELVNYDRPVSGAINMVFANNSWKQTVEWCQREGAPLLTVNRCFFGSRHDMVAIGWDGFNGDADFCLGDNLPSARWDRVGVPLADPVKRQGYILVCGEYREVDRWYRQLLQVLPNSSVKFRPHPFRSSFNPYPKIWGIAPGRAQDDIETALAGASVCITLDSIAGCDAVIAGVPSVTYSQRSMAWDVSHHTWHEYLAAPTKEFDRQAWANRIAYCQWNHEEIRNGDFWDHLKTGAAVRMRKAPARGVDPEAAPR